MDLFKIIYIIIILILILLIINNNNNNNNNNNLIEKFSYNVDRYLKSVIYDLQTQTKTYMLDINYSSLDLTKLTKLDDLTILYYSEETPDNNLEIKIRAGTGYEKIITLETSLDSDTSGHLCLQYIIDKSYNSNGEKIFYYSIAGNKTQKLYCVDITPDIIYNTNIITENDWFDYTTYKALCNKKTDGKEKGCDPTNIKPSVIPINLGQLINKLSNKKTNITIIFCFNINNIVNKYL